MNFHSIFYVKIFEGRDLAHDKDTSAMHFPHHSDLLVVHEVILSLLLRL